MVVGAAGATQTPNIDIFRSIKKPCIKTLVYAQKTTHRDTGRLAVHEVNGRVDAERDAFEQKLGDERRRVSATCERWLQVGWPPMVF